MDNQKRYYKKDNLDDRASINGSEYSTPDDIIDDLDPDTSEFSNDSILSAASPLKRLMAFIIDSAILMLIIFGITSTISFAAGVNINPTNIAYSILAFFDGRLSGELLIKLNYILAAFIWLALILIVNVPYATLLETGRLQGTLGKFICRLYVADNVGMRCNMNRALIRNLDKIISCIPFFLGYLPVFLNKDRKALHDIMSNCRLFERSSHHSSHSIINLIFTILSLAIITFLFLFGKAEAKQEPEIRQKTIQEKKPVKKAPVKKPKKRTGKLGTFYMENKSIPVNDVFVRMVENETDVTVQSILFDGELSRQEKDALENIKDIFSGSNVVTDKRSIMAIETVFTEATAYCLSNSIISATYRLNPGTLMHYFENNVIGNNNAAEQKIILNDNFSTSCPTGIGKDKSFHLRMLNKYHIAPTLSINWGFKFSAPLTEYSKLGKLSYYTNGNALALYKISTSQLSIAQYPKKLSANDLNAVRQTNSLLATNAGNRPELIINMPVQLYQVPQSNKPVVARLLAEKRLNISENNILKGYNITFYSDPFGKRRLPTGQSYYTHFPAGKKPQFLNALLKNNSPLSCKINGERTIPTQRGEYNLSWNVNLNTKVIVVK